MTAPTSSFRSSLGILIAGTVSIGFSPIFMRLSELEPTATAFHRVFLALPALWLWSVVEHRFRGQTRAAPNRREMALLIFSGLAFAGDLVFWHWAVRFTSVANAILLSNLTPIFVTLASFLLFGERFSRIFLVGVALALTGSALLVGDSFGVGADTVLGDTLGLITTLFYTTYLMTAARLRALGFSSMTVLSWGTAAATLPLLVVSLIMGESLIPTSLYGWSIILGLALVSQAAGHGMIIHALANLPAAFASVVLLLQPAVAITLAWLLLDEPLRGLQQSLGIAIIFAGIFLAGRGRPTRK
jgi:drug/metabolite transporter (DMT)-like permease